MMGKPFASLYGDDYTLPLGISQAEALHQAIWHLDRLSSHTPEAGDGNERPQLEGVNNDAHSRQERASRQRGSAVAHRDAGSRAAVGPGRAAPRRRADPGHHDQARPVPDGAPAASAHAGG